MLSLKPVNILKVFLGDDFVGTLQQVPGKEQCAFEYDQEWIRSKYSISPWELPLQKGLIFSKEGYFYGGFAAFEDSMPDGYGLYLLDRMLKREGASIKALTPLQRLALVGDAGMGALRYKPGFNMGRAVSDELKVNGDFDSIQQKALDVLSERSDADASFLYYNSNNSGGARPKAMFSGQDGSKWIVKFRHTYDPIDIGKNEYQYMSAAKECEIDIPEIKLIKNKYFAIRRFDIEDGKPLHCLTAAALLQSEFRSQTVDYSNLLSLTGFLTQDPNAVEQMFRRMVFNIIADNKDDHAKNFSFINKQGSWRLAPAYDITYSPEGTRGEHSTSVLYEGNPSLETILKAGQKIRIPRERSTEIVRSMQEICNDLLANTIQLI